MTILTAIGTRSLIDSICANTHIDSVNYGYQSLTTVAASIKYIDLKNIRDSAQTAADATTWLQVTDATGAKFDDDIAESSPPGMVTDLGFVTQLAQAGIHNFLEAGNTAIHNLATLPADTGATASSFNTGPLSYTLGDTTASDNAMVMQKSDGSHSVSLFDENALARSVTLTLPAAAQLRLFDPLTGTQAVSTAPAATTTASVSDHPVLAEI